MMEEPFPLFQMALLFEQEYVRWLTAQCDTAKHAVVRETPAPITPVPLEDDDPYQTAPMAVAKLIRDPRVF